MAMTPRDYSISALAVELGMDRRTVARRLADVRPARVSGRTKYWRLADALPHLAGAARRTPAGSPPLGLEPLEGLPNATAAQLGAAAPAAAALPAVAADPHPAWAARVAAIPEEMARIRAGYASPEEEDAAERDGGIIGRLWDTYFELEDRILATPARTRHGAIEQLRLLMRMVEEGRALGEPDLPAFASVLAILEGRP